MNSRRFVRWQILKGELIFNPLIDLRKAALLQNVDRVNHLLSAPHPLDAPADDGLTSFAIALALKNKDIVSAMLRSNLPSKEENIFLAKELLKLSPGEDHQLRELQAAITKTLKCLGMPILKFSLVEKNNISDKQKQFPFVNPKIERLPHYHKNKDWQENEIHRSLLSKNWVVNFETLRHIILGTFCLRPTSTPEHSRWELQGVKHLPCVHEHDRFVRRLT